ncbi:MAG: tRNA-dihydrouridine synthase family protein, partial [Bifidobacteriaceae bacterium]|nr:tRNA-dihydrouridine synthase family protein [Bifidobacteriaceae bacterium]
MKTCKESKNFLDNAKLVLSPMAGITNSPYRLLCQKYYKDALLIGEMVNARSLIENNPKALKLSSFSPDEINRSLQIFSAKPDEIAAAVKKIVDENLADHIDLNFGCPVRKIVKQGGGAAIPKDKVLYRQIIRAAKENADSLPITAKFRLGIDKDIITYIDAGYIAEEEGCAAVTLHARFLKQ